MQSHPPPVQVSHAQCSFWECGLGGMVRNDWISVQQSLPSPPTPCCTATHVSGRWVRHRRSLRLRKFNETFPVWRFHAGSEVRSSGWFNRTNISLWVGWTWWVWYWNSVCYEISLGFMHWDIVHLCHFQLVFHVFTLCSLSVSIT